MRNGSRRSARPLRLPVLENHLHHARRALARLDAIDVRIRPVADEPVGELDHLLRHVRVIVEADDDRHVRSDAGANAAQELAFEILEILGHARAMKIEVDGIHRHLPGEHADHLAGDALERIARDHPAGAAARPHERHVFVRIAHVGEKSRQREARVPEPLEHLRPAHERRAVAMLREVGEVGLGFDEAVRLVVEAADSDACHGLL